MKINIGHSVEGENFFGRDRELQRMIEIWQGKAAGIFVPGPRRIGKTSLVKEFIRRHREDFKFVYFDLEGRYSIVELCKDLIRTIEEKYPDFVKSRGTFKEKWNTIAQMISKISIAGIIKVETGEIEKPVKEMIDRMEDLFQLLFRNDFIIAFDEFSDFLLNLKKNSEEEVKYFLEWMRRLRQQEKIRLIITGSINIISTIEELNFPYLINDMTDVEILPLEPEEVRVLLTELLKGRQVTLSPEVLDFAVMKLSDGIPFYIQLFADGVVYYSGGNHHIDNIEEIKALYERITGKQHKEFIDLHTRLKTHLSDSYYNASRKVLAHLSQNTMSFDDLYPYIETSLPERSDANKMLKRLVDECYLTRQAGQYRFVSPMLSDWWKNHYDWEM